MHVITELHRGHKNNLIQFRTAIKSIGKERKTPGQVVFCSYLIYILFLHKFSTGLFFFALLTLLPILRTSMANDHNFYCASA
jgi:hypothetical protein